MGNTLRRATGSTSSASESRSIGSNSVPAQTRKQSPPVALAPASQSTESSDPECPICFLNYGALNVASCCRESICTNCFKQLKNSTSVQSNCPFCSSEKFAVTYVATSTPKIPGNPGPLAGGSLATGTASIVSKSASASTPLPTPPKPKVDTPVHVPLASIQDRRALEQEIQTQRESARRLRGSSFHDSGNSFTNAPSPRGRTQSEHSRSASSRLRAPQEARQNSLSLRRMNSDDGDDHDEDFEGSVEALRSLILGGSSPRVGSRTNRQIPDINEIEEMMINEAIRLSMLESSTPPPPPPTVAAVRSIPSSPTATAKATTKATIVSPSSSFAGKASVKTGIGVPTDAGKSTVIAEPRGAAVAAATPAPAATRLTTFEEAKLSRPSPAKSYGSSNDLEAAAEDEDELFVAIALSMAGGAGGDPASPSAPSAPRTSSPTAPSSSMKIGSSPATRCEMPTSAGGAAAGGAAAAAGVLGLSPNRESPIMSRSSSASLLEKIEKALSTPPGSGGTTGFKTTVRDDFQYGAPMEASAATMTNTSPSNKVSAPGGALNQAAPASSFPPSLPPPILFPALPSAGKDCSAPAGASADTPVPVVHAATVSAGSIPDDAVIEKAASSSSSR